MLLAPSGGQPYTTPWILKFLYKSDIDDPYNIYCSPNIKLLPMDIYTYYFDNNYLIDGVSSLTEFYDVLNMTKNSGFGQISGSGHGRRLRSISY